MTDTETRSILRALQTAYPHRYRNMTKGEADELVRQWSNLEPYRLVKQAVDKAVATMQFHPRIPEIKVIMDEVEEQDDMRTAFKSMLRFRISQLKAQIKPPDKLETEIERQQAAEAQKEITEIKERYKDILEGGTA